MLTQTPLSIVLLTAFLVPITASPALASCDAAGADAGAVAATRDQIDADCPCGDFSSRREYADCARTTVFAAVDMSTLPGACRSHVQRCARRSICGRPGSVVCCRERNGRVKGKIERDAVRCTSKGGTVSSGPSTCDCVASTTTTTTTSTTTTTTCPTPDWICCSDFPDPGTGCAVEAYGNPDYLAAAAAECETGIGGQVTLGRCPDPLCGPPVGCCLHDVCTEVTSQRLGWFGTTDPAAYEDSCVHTFFGQYLPGRCPE
jgi:hypothetical protein